MDEVAGTVRTYERIAGEYAQRWGAADHLATHRADFAGRLPAGALIADLGCGPGRDTAGFAALGLRVVALDRTGVMLDLVAQRGVGLPVQADLRHLRLRDATLDGAWACASLLHLAARTSHTPSSASPASCGLPACCGSASSVAAATGGAGRSH